MPLYAGFIFFRNRMLPFKHTPKNQRSKERRQGIHLSFHRTVPERIRESIRKPTNSTSRHNQENIVLRQFLAVLHYYFAGKMRDGPKQEKNRKPTRKRTHQVQPAHRILRAKRRHEQTAK